MLCKLAEEHHVCVFGDEHTGSFSGRNVEGDYQIRDDGVRGKFTSHGVAAEFSFEVGKATITVIKKPFWLPATILNQKITEGLDTLWKELARLQSS